MASDKCVHCGLEDGSHYIECPVSIARIEQEQRELDEKIATLPPEAQELVKRMAKDLLTALTEVCTTDGLNIQNELKPKRRRKKR